MSDDEGQAVKKAKKEPVSEGAEVNNGEGGASKGESVTMTPRQRELRGELSTLREKVAELKNGGNFEAAIALVAKFEKKTRLVLEYDICAEAAVLLVQLYQEQGDSKALNTAILTISKHRQQHRKVIAAIMAESMQFLESRKFADDEEYLDYLEALRSVSAGKIYLEVDAARLTMRLARHREAEGNTEEAAKILLEVAVETYGTMDKFEKAKFLLEQVRLTLVNKDFIRASIVAKKSRSTGYSRRRFSRNQAEVLRPDDPVLHSQKRPAEIV